MQPPKKRIPGRPRAVVRPPPRRRGVPAWAWAAGVVGVVAVGVAVWAVPHGGSTGGVAAPPVVPAPGGGVAPAPAGHVPAMSPDPAAVPALLRMLQDPDPERHQSAVNGLSFHGRDVPEAFAAIRRMIVEDPSPGVRAVAVAELRNFHERAIEALPEVVRALGDAEGIVRQAAAILVADWGPPAADAVPALVEMFRSGDRTSHSIAGQTLSRLGPAGARGLAGLLEGSPAALQREALMLLTAIRPLPREVEPQLRAAAASSDPGVRMAATNLLMGMGVRVEPFHP